MRRRKLVDAYSCAGGGAMGYHRAGFEVTGIDKDPQPNYPFEFIRGDALELLADPEFMARFDAAHASPPCQDHIRGGLQNDHGTGWLLAETRRLLEASGLPWVIENVPGAPMRPDYQLCGSQFGLPVRRHRWFETSWHGFSLMPPCDHSRPVHGIYGHSHGKAGAWPGMLPDGLEEWSAAMQIDWMTQPELAQALPPAYTELIGHELAGQLASEAAA